MTTTLVTGGGGFIGSHLCETLLADGRSVVCLDNFGSGRPENVAHLADDPEFALVEGDVRRLADANLPDSDGTGSDAAGADGTGSDAADADGAGAADDVDEIDEVYHLASRASPADFVTHAIDIAVTNAEGTRKVFDYAVGAGARVVLASTSEVYGDPAVHPQPETYNGNVNVRGPRACYDESKRYGEALAVAYGRVHGLDVRTARIFNTYGPRMQLDDGRVVPNFVTQALADRKITVYGDGSQTRSFAYVDDTVRGLRALMDAKGLAGEVVNLGQDTETTIRELAELVAERVGGGDIVTQPLPEDDPSRRRPDLTRARQLLDWEPSVPLETGLDRCIDDFRERREASDRDGSGD